MEQGIHEYYERADHSDNVPENLCQLYREMQNMRSATPKARYAVVEQAVAQWLEKITPETIELDKTRLSLKARKKPTGTEDFMSFMVAFAEGRAATGEAKDLHKRRIARTFQQLPEWQQILTHHYGAYVTTTRADKFDYTHLGHAAGDHHVPGIFSVYVQDDAVKKSPRLTRRILREEFFHELQNHETGQAAREQFVDGYSSPDAGAALREGKWHSAARKLIDQIDADPERSPALQLIKKSDPGGGSLMVVESLEAKMAELMVDIFDAEIYLRRQQEKRTEGVNNDEVKRQLSAAFGDAYKASHAYAEVWMDQAAKILEQKIGVTEAEKYRKKWLDDPFTHAVTLTELPHYRLLKKKNPPTLEI